MSRFIKYHPDSEMSNFLESKPNANHLAMIIAKRARRTRCPYKNLEIGQCLLGDFKKIGLTEKQYRTAKKWLKKINFAAFKGTNEGTVATLVSTEVWDINILQKGGQVDTQGATNKNVKKSTTTISEKNEDFKEPKPYTIDDARAAIERQFGKPQNQVKAIQEEYKNQTGFEVDAIKVQQGIVTFLQKGMEENYKGRIKDDEKVKSLLLRWITNQKKFDYTETITAATRRQEKEAVTLEQHIADNYKAVEIKHFKIDGQFQKWQTKFEAENFKYSNIAKGYSNPKITAAFLFEICFLPYGKNIGGTRPEMKLKTFERFFEQSSNYNQNKGDVRKLFKEYAKVKA